MKLDVYRSCSRNEKREVLNAYWHTKTRASPRIHEAASQYGPYAVLSFIAVALELAVVIAVTIHRAVVVGWIAVGLEVLVVVSLWWCLVRYRAIRQPST